MGRPLMLQWVQGWLVMSQRVHETAPYVAMGAGVDFNVVVSAGWCTTFMEGIGVTCNVVAVQGWLTTSWWVQGTACNIVVVQGVAPNVTVGAEGSSQCCSGC